MMPASGLARPKDVFLANLSDLPIDLVHLWTEIPEYRTPAIFQTFTK